MNQNPDSPVSAMPDPFDRLLGQLDGLPDVVRTRQSTLTVTGPLGIGGSQMFVLQTVRQRDEGDHLFLVCVGPGDRTVRLVLPPDVTAAIARQRDSLTSMSRRKGAKAAVQTRKERGIEPAFLKNPGKGGRKKKAEKKSGGRG